MKTDNHPDIYRQAAPHSYAHAAAKIDELVSRQIAVPAYDNSVFTTSEINFCDAPSVPRKNYDASFETMEAITVLGSYDHQKGGHIVFSDDDAMVELPVGATVLFPAGTKRYNFAAVGKNEQRFLFRQFCSAGVFRWIDKGGRSDNDFDHKAPLRAHAAWAEMRATRGHTSLKLFSKLRDVYVL